MSLNLSKALSPGGFSGYSPSARETLPARSPTCPAPAASSLNLSLTAWPLLFIEWEQSLKKRFNVFITFVSSFFSFNMSVCWGVGRGGGGGKSLKSFCEPGLSRSESQSDDHQWRWFHYCLPVFTKLYADFIVGKPIFLVPFPSTLSVSLSSSSQASAALGSGDAKASLRQVWAEAWSLYLQM